ncbi:MAG: GGDEF domain-containing protein [Bacillota bacterium]
MDKLLSKFKYILIVLLALVMIFIFTMQYSNIREVVEEKFEGQRQLVEKNIIQTMDYINDAYKIAEQQLNQEMKAYSRVMVEKYRENPEVMDWDLEQLKEEFVDYDIYIIDQNLEIIRTTYQEDLGLDFSKYSSFAKVLRERMEGSQFEADRMDLSTQAGEIKKYSYMPTPDHQYLLELSVSLPDKYPSFESLNIFRDASALTEEYEMVEEITFYSVEPAEYEVAKLRSSKKPYVNPDVPEFEEKMAQQAVLTNNMQKETRGVEGRQLDYRFFPVLNSEEEESTQGWNYYVVGIVYNDQIMQTEIAEHRRLFVVNVILLAVLFASFIAVVTYLLRKFEHQAYHDKLTGLANRKYFTEKFETLKQKADFSGSNIGLIFIDIDQFKAINDNYGHDTGDKVLESIAAKMKNNLKEEDIVARMGGDEFLVALSDLNSKSEIIKVAKRLIKELNDILVIGDEKIKISVSGGISFYPDDSRELEILIKNADSAMYKAKAKNKDLETEMKENN